MGLERTNAMMNTRGMGWDRLRYKHAAYRPKSRCLLCGYTATASASLLKCVTWVMTFDTSAVDAAVVGCVCLRAGLLRNGLMKTRHLTWCIDTSTAELQRQLNISKFWNVPNFGTFETFGRVHPCACRGRHFLISSIGGALCITICRVIFSNLQL